MISSRGQRSERRKARHSARWADSLTFGLTDKIREWGGFNDVVDHNSTGYAAGSAVGTAHGIALTVASPCSSAAWAANAVRAYNGASAVSSGLQAINDFRDGNYLSGAMNAFSAITSAAAATRACFAAGTPLLLPDGSSKLIELFLPGDAILTKPENRPEALPVPGVVAQIFVRSSPIYRLRVRGVAIDTTAEHPFWVRGKAWQPAGMLTVGDEVMSSDGRWHKVEEVGDTGRVTTVYNLQVAECHTYFVGSDEWGFDLWAHNANCPNPNGSKGKPDHQKAVDQLKNDLQKQYPVSDGYRIWSNKSIEDLTGIARRPDIAVVKGNQVIETIEVVRQTPSGSIVPREIAKQIDYFLGGVPSSVVVLP